MADIRVSVIIAAAGNSRRMNGVTGSKQLISINSRQIIDYSLEVFSKSKFVSEIIVVTKEEDILQTQIICEAYNKVKHIILGGSDRFKSVSLAFEKISPASDFVAIHDAARPLISVDFVDFLISEAYKYGSACPVAKATDTVKLSCDGLFINNTVDRSTVFFAQTPQIFKTDIYKASLNAARFSKKDFTDDASIVENSGHPVHICINEKPNIKITFPQDIQLAKFYMNGCRHEENMKIGHGYDVHRLVSGRNLILGGVKIEHSLGLLGHSDADVLTHAVMDAIIGALGLGDIGKHFPDNDEKYKNISSLELLSNVENLIKKNGYKIGNIDATIIAQEPKLAPYIPKMKQNIAEILKCEEKCINIKATTEEGLGFTGNLSGISAHAVALIK